MQIGRLKMQDWKMKDKSGTMERNMWTGKCRKNEQGWKMQDNFAGLENA